MLITANQPFGEWGKIFPDPAMTLAAVDRLVHHATIFEMNVESYRRRAALQRNHAPDGRQPTRQSNPPRSCRSTTINPHNKHCQRQSEQAQTTRRDNLSHLD